MFHEQCLFFSPFKDGMGFADSSASTEVSLASPFTVALLMQNYSRDPVAAPVMEPNPGSAEMLWSNAADVFHNVAVLDWTLFFLSLVVPRKFPINFDNSIPAKYAKVLRRHDDGVKQLPKALFGLLLLIGSLVVFSPFIIAFSVTAVVVKMILRIKYGRRVTKADPFDALWGNESDECRPYISVAVTLSGTPSVEKIRKVVQDKILDLKDRDGSLTYRKFCQVLRVEYGYFVWEDAINFDLKNHVHLWKDPLNRKDRQLTQESSGLMDAVSEVPNHVHLWKDPLNRKDRQLTQESSGLMDAVSEVPNQKDDTSIGTEDLICRYMNDHGATGMPEDKPKWEIVILDSDQCPAGRYAVVIRLHHAIGDGISLVKLIMGVMADTPLPPPVWQKPKIHFLLRVLMLMWSFCFMPLELGAAIMNRETNPLHGGKVTGKKTFHVSRRMSLDTMKKIKSASGSKINDVLMACLSAAFSKTFGERCGERMSLMLPVCFHDPDEPPLVNKILMAPLLLPTPVPSSEVTAAKRLQIVKEQCETMKRTPGLIAGRYTMGLMSAMMPACVAKKIFVLQGLTMGVSNVPGPQYELSLWGDTMENVCFWVPDKDPTGAGVGIISYRGMLTLGLSCDTGMGATSQELQQVVTEFEREVEDMSACFCEHKKKD